MIQFFVTMAIILIAVTLWKWPGTRRAQLLAIFMIGTGGGFLLGNGIGKLSTLRHGSAVSFLYEAASRIVNEDAPEACPRPPEDGRPHRSCDTREKLAARLRQSFMDIDALVKVIFDARTSKEVASAQRMPRRDER